MMRFANPYLLLLLLLIIPVIFNNKKSGGRIRYSNIELLKGIRGLGGLNPRMILLFIRILAIILFVLALSRPQAGKKYSEIMSEGVDIVLALDTSGSMQFLDFKINNERVDRLQVVKKVVRDFIKKRPQDRIGLVVFGSEAFTQCPLTADHGILMDFLDRAEIGMAGEATAIGQALGTSVNRLKEVKGKSKIAILLTDGANNAGTIPPLKAADLAQSYKIKVYTVAVGTNDKVPYYAMNPFTGGKQIMFTHAPVIDEELLKNIAKVTDGRYYRAQDLDQLENIYREIDKLEKRKVKIKEYTDFKELFHWFLIPGLLLILVEIVLSQTKLRKIP